MEKLAEKVVNIFIVSRLTSHNVVIRYHRKRMFKKLSLHNFKLKTAFKKLPSHNLN